MLFLGCERSDENLPYLKYTGYIKFDTVSIFGNQSPMYVSLKLINGKVKIKTTENWITNTGEEYKINHNGLYEFSDSLLIFRFTEKESEKFENGERELTKMDQSGIFSNTFRYSIKEDSLILTEYFKYLPDSIYTVSFRLIKK